jgi:hypothetical protein
MPLYSSTFFCFKTGSSLFVKHLTAKYFLEAHFT